MFEDNRTIRPPRGLWRRAAVLAVALAALLSLGLARAETEQVVEAPDQTVTVTGGMSNAEAAEGYINSILYPNARRPKGANLGANLEGNDAAIFNILKDKVAAVAAGTLSSTEFVIDFSDVVTKSDYTADELGVEIFVDGAFNDTAKKAVKRFYDVNMTNVNNALLNDYPHEMYWYDKTIGCSSETDFSFSVGGSNGIYILTVRGRYTIKFTVAKEYSVSDAENTTAFNTAKYGYYKVATAAENAKGIVDGNASLSNYDKLAAYKKAICDSVAYNHKAAEKEDTPYGNPWQLIWVFDGDEKTNVVCEGYSKAFQYLCDRSKFRGKVSAICATGTMSGGTGEGLHMWNIVTMEDGKNYLVDVTNCDGAEENEENSIGFPDWLFMKGYADYDDEQGVYFYDCDENGTVQAYYYYDQSALDTFGSTGRLALSAKDYVPGSGGEVDRYPYTLTLPEDTETIGSQAFANLGISVNVRIPESVNEIADDAFSGSDVILIFDEAQRNAADLKKYAEDENHPLPYIAEH